MLKGRLGIETARIPHADRHGLLYLSRGTLFVENGTLRFATPGDGEIGTGDYSIPYQTVSFILMGPGSTVTHDSLRLMASHGTGLICVGEGNVKFYASMPFGPGDSEIARRQVRLWSDGEGSRIEVARRMYGIRLVEVFPHDSLDVLRGIEGVRMRQSYKVLADKFGVSWNGRVYDRKRPNETDLPNQAINHAATFVEAAAMIAVAATGTIPNLGFIHEDAAISFCLDIADLYRTEITIPLAFRSVSIFLKKSGTDQYNTTLEKEIRYAAASVFKEEKLISRMIDSIKLVLKDDNSSNS
ncbi:type I-E CRISPR-associated endonuclease Cas1 [bacterium]|nr:type I-E CRISPR-associated endonuclease Cas1 [candidate division CSSED10-310 bacterium]